MDELAVQLEEQSQLSKLRSLAPDGKHLTYLQLAITLAAVNASEEQVWEFARGVARGDI